MPPKPAPIRPLALWGVAVVGTALLAHGGCLSSTFYLDDWTQVVDCDGVDQGRWSSYGQRAVTYLTYFLTWRAAGMSALAFHAGNLLLHVVVSLALLGFARDFLEDAARLPAARARRIGGWGALLFAVHPLCSEMPNYVRARDIGLVSLWALLAAWAALRWRRDGAFHWGGALFATLAAAAFSKEVGLPLATGTAALVAFGASRRTNANDPAKPPAARRRRYVILAGGAALVLLAAAFASNLVTLLAGTIRQSLHDSRFGWHLLTEARVFWMYLARVAWPAHLCSDHLIPWTVSLGDPVAWVAVTGQSAAVLLAVAALCQRRHPAVRAAGVLGAVALLDILHRLANVSAELMVEYRMYPAMLPICILLAWGLDVLREAASTRWRLRPLAPRAALGGVIAIYVLISALRARDWRTSDALVANIVAQYPDNARARQELQEADIRAGRWASAVARQDGIREAFGNALAFNASQTLRRYDLDELTMIRIISEANAALGLAQLGHRADAFARLTWIHTNMDNNHLTIPLYWSSFYYGSALVHAAAGERQDALDDLRVSAELDGNRLGYPARQLRRYQAGDPLP